MSADSGGRAPRAPTLLRRPIASDATVQPRPEAARQAGPDPRTRRIRHGEVRLSSHILPAAGTMVGVCTTLIGLVKIAEAGGGAPSTVDKCYGLAALVFLASAFTSYLSMRVDPEDRLAPWLERIADWCFMVGLIGLATISLLFAYETI